MKRNLYRCRSLLLLALLLSISWISKAQNPINVKGKVADTKGEAIPGASVVLKGSTRGVVTDVNGNFVFSVPDTKAVLVFSYLGYEPKEISVGTRTTIDVMLDSKANELDNLVVIGYGTQRKSDLTGSVSSIKQDQLLERPSPSLNQALTGRMAGVQVNNNSGRPGGRTTVRVRGFSSINSSNNPLYVRCKRSQWCNIGNHQKRKSWRRLCNLQC
jgi:hypothetical protein